MTYRLTNALSEDINIISHEYPVSPSRVIGSIDLHCGWFAKSFMKFKTIIAMPTVIKLNIAFSMNGPLPGAFFFTIYIIKTFFFAAAVLFSGQPSVAVRRFVAEQPFSAVQ